MPCTCLYTERLLSVPSPAPVHGQIVSGKETKSTSDSMGHALLLGRGSRGPARRVLPPLTYTPFKLSWEIGPDSFLFSRYHCPIHKPATLSAQHINPNSQTLKVQSVIVSRVHKGGLADFYECFSYSELRELVTHPGNDATLDRCEWELISHDNFKGLCV